MTTFDCYYLACVFGWILTIIIGAIGAKIVVLIIQGKKGIDLTNILVEPTTGKASLSRLQFLIFTFVIALSLFLVVIVGDGKTPKFPDKIAPEILLLLGISGGTYAVAKGVDANKRVEEEKTNVEMAKVDPNKADSMKLPKLPEKQS